MTVDQPGGEPLVLVTRHPAQLIGQPTRYPPRADRHRLQNPVELVLPSDPDTSIATIQRWPAKIGGL